MPSRTERAVLACLCQAGGAKRRRHFVFCALPESMFFPKLRRLPGADRQAINRLDAKAVLMFFQFCFCFETKNNLSNRLHFVTALLLLVVGAKLLALVLYSVPIIVLALTCLLQAGKTRAKSAA